MSPLAMWSAATFLTCFSLLGASALITPLIVAQQLVRFDVPLMIGVSIAAWLFALNGYVERWEGALLFAGIVAYTVFLGVQNGISQSLLAFRRPSHSHHDWGECGS